MLKNKKTKWNTVITRINGRMEVSMAHVGIGLRNEIRLSSYRHCK